VIANGKREVVPGLFPNLAQAKVNIQLSHFSAGKYTVRITNSNVAAVKNKVIQVNLPFEQININIERLAKGNYFVTLVNEAGASVVSETIMKQ